MNENRIYTILDRIENKLDENIILAQRMHTQIPFCQTKEDCIKIRHETNSANRKQNAIIWVALISAIGAIVTSCIQFVVL